MRKALNDNPLIAVGVVALLGLFVAFMLLHALSRPKPSTSTTTTPTTAVPGAIAAAPTATADPTAAAPTTAVPTTDPSATGVLPATPAPATVGDFKAGPGLPKQVVAAYNSGKVVAIVVLKRNGIDDHDVARATAPLHSDPNVALFTTLASKVARYARVTEGVDLNRVPAIVVMRPKPLTHGGTPQASVGYGFKSLQSAEQAIRDATYKGPNNLPAYPR
jgi:hypothetical protein